MRISVTLGSESDLILGLVGDFARGLGCAVDMAPTSSGRRIRIDVGDDDWRLLELLTHVALSAAKAGVDVGEPLCQVTYQHRSVPSEVTLTLRITEFRIDRATGIGP
jgi:hypothetical protein